MTFATIPLTSLFGVFPGDDCSPYFGDHHHFLHLFKQWMIIYPGKKVFPDNRIGIADNNRASLIEIDLHVIHLGGRLEIVWINSTTSLVEQYPFTSS